MLIALHAVLGHAESGTSNKWRIEFSEGANSHGKIIFHVSTDNGESFDISTSIDDGDSENHIARRVRDSFRDALPHHYYDVEIDDGEDVLIKEQNGAGPFRLRLVDSTVKSVRIDLDRE